MVLLLCQVCKLLENVQMLVYMGQIGLEQIHYLTQLFLVEGLLFML